MMRTSIWVPQMARSLSVVRHRSFAAFVDFDAPESAEARVNETLSKMAAEGKAETTQYFHALVNKAICQFHQRRFVEARDVAHDAHRRIVAAKGPHSSSAYFSAVTVAQCATALAAEYAKHLEEVAASSNGSDSLLPSASKKLRSEEALEQLQKEAALFRVTAERIYNLPCNSFMRRASKPSAGWEEHDTTQQQQPYRRKQTAQRAHRGPK